MKRNDAKNLFSSVWDDNEVIILFWSKEIIEDYTDRLMTTNEWNALVTKWEQSNEADHASETVGEAIIEQSGLGEGLYRSFD